MPRDIGTPLISRSDGRSFHLYLFSGHDLCHAKSGGIIAGRESSTYFYASDKLGVNHDSVTVIFRTVDLDSVSVENAMRDAADQMASILFNGEALEPDLYYDRGSLTVLDPAARP